MLDQLIDSAKAYSAHLILSLCLLLTLVASYNLHRSAQSENAKLLDDIAERVQGSVLFRMNRYESTLVQMRAFVVTAENFDRESFRRYVDNLTLLEKYPGIQGLGYTLRIEPENLEAHIKEVQQQGFPGYRVWPEDPRSMYFSIIYLEPFDWRNQRAFGYDMFTNPVRREAMEQARDTGQPATSGRVELVQETSSQTQPGFLIYVPVYESGVTPSTTEGRRAALQGFVYSPFRAKDLFSALFQSDLATFEKVRVGIYDGGELSPQNLLYDSQSLFEETESGFPEPVKTRQVQVPGRTWTLAFVPRQQIVSASARHAPWAVALLGTLLSFLLYLMIASARRHALKESASRETLSEINRVSRRISAELDLEKLVQGVTDTATKITGAQFGAFFYKVVEASGEALTLYTISGVPKECFSHFPLPKKTLLFATAFDGTGIVRSADITQDSRYGKSPPHFGMPEGHLPVRSYLAVPVIARSGEVLGALFFGHKEVGVFGQREEDIVAGVAAHTAVAIDNASLYRSSREAVLARDQFLSICSHELKTPLTSLKLQVQISKRQLKKGESFDSDELMELFGSLEQQFDRLTELVDDMLDVGQIETGRVSLVMERIDLAQVIQETVKHFLPQAQAQDVEINLTQSVPAEVHADSHRITQVLINLLSNALRYGRGKPIEVRSWIEGNRAKVSIRDQGLGIREPDLKRIFERFERSVSYRNISGLGLGLFISRQVAEAHGGSIQVESQIDEGSVFTLELPLAMVPSEKEPEV